MLVNINFKKGLCKQTSKYFKNSQKLIDYEQKEGVVKPIEAKQLFETLDLDLDEEGLDGEKFESLLEDIVLSTPRTSTKLFFNQLFGWSKFIKAL